MAYTVEDSIEDAVLAAFDESRHLNYGSVVNHLLHAVYMMERRSHMGTVNFRVSEAEHEETLRIMNEEYYRRYPERKPKE